MEIEGFPNYLIYSDGRVWTKKRERVKEGFLKPNKFNGYLHVVLCNNRKQKSFKIHRLVAIHYIPNPENKLFVDHINRVRDDNNIENLRWATKSENGRNRTIKKDKKVSHLWIKENGNSYAFARVGCKKKFSPNIPKLLCYSFFYLLKYPY
tara:strand:+ start:45 stop:497 length:453 start_codon:yes stop_codon:yes gene_type:complete